MVRNELGLKHQTFREESTDALLLFPCFDGTGMVCYDVYARGGLQPYFPTEPPSTVAPTTSTAAPPRPRRSFQEIFQQGSNEASFFFTFRKLTNFLGFFMYFIQHCFVCRSSDSTVSEDAGIEPRIVATLALTAVRKCTIFYTTFCLHWKI
jgi:hypothetical protein